MDGSRQVRYLDMKKCNLSDYLAHDQLEWRNKIHVVDPNILGQGFDVDDLYIKCIKLICK